MPDSRIEPAGSSAGNGPGTKKAVCRQPGRPSSSAAQCCDKTYFCPTSGETECPIHGGFDVCCDRPDLHKRSQAEAIGTDTAATTEPLTYYEMNELATYNGQVHQGLVHTAEKKARMAEFQQRFDTAGYLPEHERKFRVHF